jgi:hypothetical protein
MQEPAKSRKGFLNLVNLVGIVVSCLIYFYLFLPIYQPAANTAIAALDITWQFYLPTVILIQIVPLFVIITIMLGVLNQAQPQYG